MLFENHIWAFENDVNWKEKNKLLQKKKSYYTGRYFGFYFI